MNQTRRRPQLAQRVQNPNFSFGEADVECFDVERGIVVPCKNKTTSATVTSTSKHRTTTERVRIRTHAAPQSNDNLTRYGIPALVTFVIILFILIAGGLYCCHRSRKKKRKTRKRPPSQLSLDLIPNDGAAAGTPATAPLVRPRTIEVPSKPKPLPMPRSLSPELARFQQVKQDLRPPSQPAKSQLNQCKPIPKPRQTVSNSSQPNEYSNQWKPGEYQNAKR